MSYILITLLVNLYLVYLGLRKVFLVRIVFVCIVAYRLVELRLVFFRCCLFSCMFNWILFVKFCFFFSWILRSCFNLLLLLKCIWLSGGGTMFFFLWIISRFWCFLVLLLLFESLFWYVVNIIIKNYKVGISTMNLKMRFRFFR